MVNGAAPYFYVYFLCNWAKHPLPFTLYRLPLRRSRIYLTHTAQGEPVTLVAVVLRADGAAIEAQVIRSRGTVLRQRPIVRARNRESTP